MATTTHIDAVTVIGEIAALMEEPTVRLATNALTRADASEVMARRDVSTSYTHSYSNKVPAEYKATSQKSSGRCWMFAALNLARGTLIEKYNLSKDFELSQTFAFFWDKYERANYFLEAAIDLVDEPVDGRVMQYILKTPLNDGGQWDMFVSLVNKYGLVPKNVYPETHSSGASRRMNRMLTFKLRGWAAELRNAEAGERQSMKVNFLKQFLKALTVSLGPPPSTFDWVFNDKDGNQHRFPGLTPKQFYADHLVANGFDFNDYISLINDPRNEYSKAYTVDRLGNVAGSPGIRYINVEIEQLRAYTQKSIDKGDAVWFGCDVGKDFHRKMAVMDTELYDYELFFGIKHPTKDMDKKTRLQYHASLMTHAMVFTAYDVTPGETAVNKWRVENSWGTGVKPNTGDEFGLEDGKGYYLMTDSWFTEYMYQIAVKKEDLDDSLKPFIETEPTVLPPWDPMGALASVSGELDGDLLD